MIINYTADIYINNEDLGSTLESYGLAPTEENIKKIVTELADGQIDQLHNLMDTWVENVLEDIEPDVIDDKSYEVIDELKEEYGQLKE